MEVGVVGEIVRCASTLKSLQAIKQAAAKSRQSWSTGCRLCGLTAQPFPAFASHGCVSLATAKGLGIQCQLTCKLSDRGAALRAEIEKRVSQEKPT